MLNTDYVGSLKGTLYQGVNVLDSYSNDVSYSYFHLIFDIGHTFWHFYLRDI